LHPRPWGSEPLQIASNDWDLITEAIKNGKNKAAIDMLEIIRGESQRNNDNLVSFAEMALAFVTEFDEQAIFKFLKERYLIRMKEFFSTTIHYDEYLGKCIAAQKRHHANFSIREEVDKFVVTYDPCGSGGRLQRNRTVGRTAKPYPWSWGKTGVPYYCCHCCVSWEIIATELNGYPVKITMIGDGPKDPCVHLFYKKPDLIPEEYFLRIGMKRDVSRFDLLANSHTME